MSMSATTPEISPEDREFAELARKTYDHPYWTGGAEMTEEESAAWRLVENAADSLENRGKPFGPDAPDRPGPDAPPGGAHASVEWRMHILELLDLGFTTRAQLEAVSARFQRANMLREGLLPFTGRTIFREMQQGRMRPPAQP